MKKIISRLTSFLIMSTVLSGCRVSNLQVQQTTGADAQSQQVSSVMDASQPELELTFKMAFNNSAEPALTANRMVADEIEKQSGGKIKVERYLEGQLYNKDEDGSVAVSEGTVQMILMGDMMASNTAPEIVGYTTIPFAFKNKEHCKKFWTGIYGEQVNQKLAEKYGAIAFFDCMQLRGGRMLSANKPIKSLDDLKGMKLRLPNVPPMIAAWETLGVSVTPVALGDLFGSLQSGVVNGQENPIEIFYGNKYYEVQKYLMLTEHNYSYRAYHVNKRWWDSVSEENQDIIKKAMVVGADYYNAAVEDMDEEWIELIQEAGTTVIPKNEIDTTAFKERSIQSTLEKFGEEWQPGVWENIQEMGKEFED